MRAARFPSFRATEVREPAPAPAPPPSATVAADLAREAARVQGLAQGQQEGREAALADWAPRLTALAAALEKTIAIVRAERERLAAEVAETVPQVAIDLARKVLERELADSERAVRAAIDPVVRRLAQSGGAAVRVAPEVAEALEVWCRDAGRPPALTGVVIRADESLGRGDWIIETDGGFLDGRLATQLEEAARILLEPEA